MAENGKKWFGFGPNTDTLSKKRSTIQSNIHGIYWAILLNKYAWGRL